MATNELTTMLENAPLPEIIKNLAVAVGEAQFALDLNSIEQFKLMAKGGKEHGVEFDDGEYRSLVELGMVPAFYHFTESTIEAQVAFSMSESREFSVSASLEVSVVAKIVTIGVSMSASYSSRYSFDASGSSVISTKLVSVPPPPALAELVNRMTLGKAPEKKE